MESRKMILMHLFLFLNKNYFFLLSRIRSIWFWQIYTDIDTIFFSFIVLNLFFKYLDFTTYSIYRYIIP